MGDQIPIVALGMEQNYRAGDGGSHPRGNMQNPGKTVKLVCVVVNIVSVKV